MKDRPVRYIFSLYGPTRSGKSTLIAEMVRRHPDRIDVIRSVTTRPKRGPEDEANYSHHLSDEDFLAWCGDGRIVQHVTYGDRRYGTAKAELERVFAMGHGICAMTEDGMINMRDAGYRVVPIQVIPLHVPKDLLPDRNDDLARQADDAARAKIRFQPLIVAVNDFAPGRLANTLNVLERDIFRFIDGAALSDPR